MECNKDEAVRAKEIAENKLTEKDVTGAKRFASKAQNLFPGLEGLSQFQEVLDVYIAADRKVCGEVDYYEVLGVDPLDDDVTIKEKYRKLALAVHPDKNKTVGADGAFKILSAAWSILSDKYKRAAYNKMREVRPSFSKGTGLNPAVSVQKNDRYSFTKTPSAAKKTSAKKSSSPANPVTDSTHTRSNGNTFWTSCRQCMIQYEYLAIYRNKNLLCPNCRQPFMAIEMPPPPAKIRNRFTSKRESGEQKSGHPANSTSSDSGRKFTPTPKMGTPGFTAFDSVSKENAAQGSSFKFGSSSMPKAAKATAQPAHTFQSAGENLKRGREVASSGTVNEEDGRKKGIASKTTDGLPAYNGPIVGKREKPAKKRRADEHKASLQTKGLLNQMPPGGAGCGSSHDSGNKMGRLETEKLVAPGSQKPRHLKELSHSETRNMLMEKAKMEIWKQLQVWKTANNTLMSSGKVGIEMKKDKPTSVPAPEESVVPGMPRAIIMNTSIEASLSSVATYSNTKASKVMSMSIPNSDGPKEPLSASTIGSDTKANETMTMDVPDSEFYYFDKDRIEDVFAKNQVWAAYGDEDGMPRYYAIIRDVISKTPFEIHIRWLDSKSNSEFSPMNRVGSGYAKTCGDFKIGKHEINKALNSFSHRVKWTKGSKGIIHIFPKKGDVWALYRNWSSDWNELTPDDVVQQYDVVEVVRDYNEEQGVAVAPLVKVAGFRSVFHQHLDSAKMFTISREEMFRFSHQVPSYLLTGQEAETAPKGCRELDTGAMPLELLQVIKESSEAEGGRTAEKVSGMGDADAIMISGDANDVVTEEIMMYSRKSDGKKVVGDTSRDNEVTIYVG